MVKAACSEEEFIELFEKFGAAETARILGVGERTVYVRRVVLERKLGRQLTLPDPHRGTRRKIHHPHRAEFEMNNGVVLVGGDAHYWPNYISPAHRAFVKFCKDLKPKIVVKNGDDLDAPSISRHPPIGWETTPPLIDELKVVGERNDEIRAAAKNAKLVWPLGNHCARYETRLATVAPEYAKIHGFHLKDHFPHWHPCWSCWINDDVVIKHCFKSGIHAPHNNTLWAGRTMITGHLHSLKVMPITDYNGTRWGIDSGTLADPDGPQFVDYTEDNPKNWRSGFIVLTFHKGTLLWPEIVYVIDENHVGFRGDVIKV